jgi:opacity protein-like surface antigen
MRSRLILLAVVCTFSTVSLFAQSDRKAEVFVGYSNLQAQGLPDKNNVTGVFSSDFLNNRSTLHGFATEVNGFLSGPVGLTGSFSFNENKQSFDNSFRSDEVKTDILYFMGGPSFKFGSSSRFQPFVRVMAGGANTRFDVNQERFLSSGTLTNSFNAHTTDFAMGAGGGLDWRVSDKLKVRLFQVDYTPIFLRDQSVRTLTDAGAIEPATLNGQRMDNVRFVFGVVF